MPLVASPWAASLATAFRAAAARDGFASTPSAAHNAAHLRGSAHLFFMATALKALIPRASRDWGFARRAEGSRGPVPR